MCVQLVRTLRQVLSSHDWWHLPRFAFGSSRGGAMTLILAMRFPFQVGDRTSSLRTLCTTEGCLSSFKGIGDFWFAIDGEAIMRVSYMQMFCADSK